MRMGAIHDALHVSLPPPVVVGIAESLAENSLVGIAVAYVAGGSNLAVAEYAVSVALTLMRRFTW